MKTIFIDVRQRRRFVTTIRLQSTERKHRTSPIVDGRFEVLMYVHVMELCVSEYIVITKSALYNSLK